MPSPSNCATLSTKRPVDPSIFSSPILFDDRDGVVICCQRYFAFLTSHPLRLCASALKSIPSLPHFPLPLTASLITISRLSCKSAIIFSSAAIALSILPVSASKYFTIAFCSEREGIATLIIFISSYRVVHKSATIPRPLR